ncbi:MAG: RNase P modulator RnpM [Saccharofermentanales bacterium]
MQKKVPDRMCIACNMMKPKKELVRVTGDKEGNVAIDLKGKASGRGAYICRSTECYTKARKGKKLEKALKMPVPAQIWEMLGTLPGIGTENDE